MTTDSSFFRSHVVRAIISPEILAIVLLVVGWEAIARTFDISFIPTVSGIVDRFVELFSTGEVLGDVRRSLTNLLIGFTISLAIAQPLGLLMGRFRVVQYALEPYINAMLMAPTLVFAPIFFVVFGLSPKSLIAVIVMYSAFMMVSNTFTAVRQVDGALIDMARVYGASELQIFGKIVLPAASPLILAGTRMGISRAVEGMINGELFIAAVGLGARLMDFGGLFDAEGILAIVLFVMIVASVCTALVQYIERRMTGRWTGLHR